MNTPLENLLLALEQAAQHTFECLEGEDSALMRSYFAQVQYHIGKAAGFVYFAERYAEDRDV